MADANETISNEPGAIFAVTGVIATACSIGDYVVITGDQEVTASGAGGIPVGIVAALPASFPGKGTIETMFRRRMLVTVSEEVTAGDLAKIAAPTEAGAQRFTKWDSEHDSPTIIVGQYWTGADSGASAQLLTN
jgi:hypothetical protein